MCNFVVVIFVLKSYLPKFVQAIWQLLVTTDAKVKHDLVSHDHPYCQGYISHVTGVCLPSHLKSIPHPKSTVKNKTVNFSSRWVGLV